MSEQTKPSVGDRRRWSGRLGAAIGGLVGRRDGDEEGRGLSGRLSPRGWRRWALAGVALVFVAVAAASVAYPWGAFYGRLGGGEPTADVSPTGAESVRAPMAGSLEQLAGSESRLVPSDLVRDSAASVPQRQLDQRQPDSSAVAAEVEDVTRASRAGSAVESSAVQTRGDERRQLFLAPSGEVDVVESQGWHRHPIHQEWRYQPGVELAVVPGETVRAASAGVVVGVDQDERWGLTVRIRHEDGWQTAYGYLREVTLLEGEQVDAGAPIGVAGETPWGEPRLFFQVSKEGSAVDPLPFLGL